MAMFSNIKSIRTAVILTILLFLPTAAYPVPFISKETEIEMGQGADPQVIRQFGLYQDKELQLYVNEIGQKMVSHLTNPEFHNYFFKVVDSPEINAFALPGGYIYVTRGILAAFNNEAELAGVLGHEIGHVVLHHGAKSMIRSIGAQLLAIGGAIASPSNAGAWVAVSTQLFSTINLGYGRDAELESDAHGLLNTYKVGYDPKSTVDFFQTLRQHEIMTGQSYHSFVATHPETRERIIKAGSLADSIVARGDKSKFIVNRDSYLKKLKGMTFGGKRDRRDRRNYKPQYIDIYEVQPGDTLHSIAKNHLGDEKKDLEIAVLNGLKPETPLKPGFLLKIVRDGKYKKEKSLVLRPDAS